MNKHEKNCVCLDCEFRNVVLRYLDDAEIEELCDHKHEQIYRKGEIICHQGEKITKFRYLKSGLVKLYRQHGQGEEQIIAITRPFEFVTDLAIFEETSYRFSVSALEDSVICAVDIEFMKEILMRNGGFATGLLSRMAGVNNRIITQCLEIRRRNLAGRVALVLIYFSKEIYNNNQIFELPVSRKEISDYIGMSIANVIRTLSDFKKEDIIKIEGKTIEILDFKKLELISERG